MTGPDSGDVDDPADAFDLVDTSPDEPSGVVIEGPDGPVSLEFYERTFNDSAEGSTVVKGGGPESSPGAMDALMQGGVDAWRAYLAAHPEG